MLRILFVAHGNMPIPPTGWGAVESLIWDYSVHLKKLGHSVNILNIPIDQVDRILDHIHNNKYDVIHLHNDILVNILHLMPKTLPVVLSSHYPYIHDPTQWADPVTGYDYGKYVMTPLLKAVHTFGTHVIAISQKDRDAFVSYGVPRESVSVCVNGMDTSKFVLGAVTNPGSMICLAQIIPRKRQHLFKGLDFIKCVGALNDEGALPSQEQYIGEWTTDEKYQNLTQYSGGILLSDGENGTPLSVKESLAAGLGLVVSEAVASEIPKEWSWVTVIPETKIGDQAYLKEACQKIMDLRALKGQIRAEAAALWDWSALVPKYVEVLKGVIGEQIVP